MIDISELDIYIKPISELQYNSAKDTCLKQMFTNWFDDQLNVFLNCSKHLPNGQCLIMTTDPRYNIEISTTIAMIELFCEKEDEKDYFLEQLLIRHKSNIEYEKLNPPTYEIKKTKTKKVAKPRVPKEKTPKEPRETTAERKLKERAIKLNSISLKIKPL